MNILPNHKAIHTQALSRIFERTTTSYKYLFCCVKAYEKILLLTSIVFRGDYRKR